MWQQHYTPVADSLGFSALVASLPIFVLLWLIGVKRKAAWIAALSGLGSAAALALFVYGMPAKLMITSVGFGAAFGLFPIAWIVYWAIVLYNLTKETGKFEIIKDSIGGLTEDRRLQAMLIAFALGAFIEGAAGFGTPVAVAAAMLTGLGFSPFYSAAICLLANTAPVAFGSIGIPIITLSGITELPQMELSAWVGRICAPVSLFIPTYLILVMGGVKALRGVLPAAAVCGITFAGCQFFVSNYIGPQLTDILSALAAILSLVILFLVWKPKDEFHLAGETVEVDKPKKHRAGEVLLAWSPYLFLVFFVLLWGQKGVKPFLDKAAIKFAWPGLHMMVERIPPVVAKAAGYPAEFSFNFLSASGTACLFATLAGAIALGIPPGRYLRILASTWKQMYKSILTIASVLALAFLMNYCGATATLGLAFAATGVLFPYFSAMLGWLGVFLTGSDTSANALFGNLQKVTAIRLNLDPVLMASSNSAGGVMGKMISLQSIAVAAAATHMKPEDEGRLFRFTMRHSILLASILGLITTFYAYGLK